MSFVCNTCKILILLALFVVPFITSGTASAQVGQEQFLFTGDTVTGRITDWHANALGEIDYYEVTKADNTTIRIDVTTPTTGTSSIVKDAYKAGTKMDVEYHDAGHPAVHWQDGISPH